MDRESGSRLTNCTLSVLCDCVPFPSRGVTQERTVIEEKNGSRNHSDSACPYHTIIADNNISITGRIVRKANCRCHLFSGQFFGFSSYGATRCVDQCEIWRPIAAL